MRKTDIDSFNQSLTEAGYSVTYVKDGNVTVDFIVNHLNDYQVIIWRTAPYVQDHVYYWYLGQQDNRGLDQTYANDIASQLLDNSHGVLGASVAFFTKYFGPNTLSNVKLIILVSDMSALFATSFITAGAKSVIDFVDNVDLQFNWSDYLTTIMVRFLANGESVENAVSDTITPLQTMILRDSLDSMVVPDVATLGDAGLVIT
jgi:hypothetical protein